MLETFLMRYHVTEVHVRCYKKCFVVQMSQEQLWRMKYDYVDLSAVSLFVRIQIS